MRTGWLGLEETGSVELLNIRRTSARRALSPVRVMVSSTDERDSDPSGAPDWVRHGIAGLIVALLGLVIASSFGLTTSTDHTDASANPRMTADAPDVTQAEPEGVHLGTDSSAGSARDRDPENDTGTLDVYDRREQSTSREALRQELAKLAAAQQARQRAKGLSSSSDKARDDAAEKARDKRTGDVQDAAEATRVEQARLVEAKRKAAEEKRKAAEEKRKAIEAAKIAAAAAAKIKAQASTTGTGVPARLAARVGVPQVSAEDIPSGNAVTPLSYGSYRLSARWGAYGSWSRWHTGMDLSASIGTPIRAAAPGVVVGDSANGWAGIHVSIRHADESATLYAHMSGRTVAPGTVVQAGTVIGYVGMTGRTFGPHLHFEYYPPGTSPGDVYSARDPWAWMYAQGVRL